MNDLDRPLNAVPLVIKRYKTNQAILNKNTPEDAVSTITVLQTSKLSATARLSGCNMDDQKQSFKKGINLL